MKNITLLSLVAAALLFTACGEKTKEAATDAANAVTEAVKEDTSSAVEATKKVAVEAAEVAKTKANELSLIAKEAKKTAEAKAIAAAAALKERAAATLKEKPKETVEVTVPAAYESCKGCHGVDGKIKALGKSDIIAGQPKEQIIDSLKAYKAGTKNINGMGMLMKGQVALMSDEEMEEIADYLSNL